MFFVFCSKTSIQSFEVTFFKSHFCRWNKEFYEEIFGYYNWGVPNPINNQESYLVLRTLWFHDLDLKQVGKISCIVLIYLIEYWLCTVLYSLWGHTISSHVPCIVLSTSSPLYDMNSLHPTTSDIVQWYWAGKRQKLTIKVA